MQTEEEFPLLSLEIPEKILIQEETDEIIKIRATKIQLEHSLIALKKWESKWHKAFLKEDEKSDEELKDYIRCMTVSTNVDPLIYEFMDQSTMQKIIDYINDPMTATVIRTSPKSDLPIKKGDTTTAEVIYYWMITLGIPVEFQKWHLNSLITLINVVAVKSQGNSKKKMSPSEISAEQARRDAINAQRRAKYNTKG